MPFYICNAMKAFEVHKNNKTFASVDGVLFDKNIETLLKYPKADAVSMSCPKR